MNNQIFILKIKNNHNVCEQINFEGLENLLSS